MLKRTVDDLIPSIVEATEEGALVWKRLNDSHLEAKLPRFSLQVSNWLDEDSTTSGLTLELRLADGRRIDYAKVDEYDSHFRDLGRLFQAARRSADNVSDAISEVERELAALTSSRR